MPNPEHVRLLLDGVEGWNAWRNENPEIRPDLSRAHLVMASLFDVDLSGADLSGADFGGADFRWANLRGTNLRGAILSGARLSRADLSGADLHGAELELTTFHGTNLSACQGLAEVKHLGGSGLDPGTVEYSRELPVSFLRGCGWPERLVEFWPSISEQGIQFYSAFISYSSDDDEFVRKLYGDLQNAGVRCWFAPEDMKIGGKIRDELHTHIRHRDKLVLVLSEESVRSRWVELEVETAFEEEDRRGETVLFPIMVDRFVLDVDTGWARQIRQTRNIGDFTDWKNHDSYKKAFDRVLKDLKPETPE